MCNYQSEESAAAFEAVFSQSQEILQCKSEITAFLKDIPGL